MGTTLRIADVYYRLSVEDERNIGKKQKLSEESESIINQRKLVEDYCERNGIIIAREFVDDGYSGSNFERPGFQKMLQHLKGGTVNTVITKDLSRLGRDMVESGYYAETYFPEHGIQFIAIGDDFDSQKDNMMMPFKLAMNDVYLRDTSRKIKQVMESKRQRGEYCACPPFGYKKDTRNRDVLVPDERTAPIVQYIFRLAVEGKSAHSIANQLTEEKYITPLKYRVLYRDEFSDKGASRATDVWNHTTVKRILKNRVYLGHTVLGKSKRASIKSKMKVNLPEEEWVVTKNTHQPLVTEEDFEKAQMYMGMNTKAWSDNPRCRKSIFNGLVFCENCGTAMCSAGSVYKGEREKYWYLACNNIPQRSASKKCEHGARIRYSDLLEVVRCELNQFLRLDESDMDEITKAAIKSVADNMVYEGAEAQLAAMEKRLSEIDKIIGKLYNDNAQGIIDDDRLARMVKELIDETKSIKVKIEKLKANRTEEDDIKDAYDAFFKLVKRFTHIDELTEDVVRTFIERIEIGEKILPPGYTVASHKIPYKQKIKIYYRFIGNIADEEMKYWNDAENSEFDGREAG